MSTQAKLVATPLSSAIFRSSRTEPLSSPFLCPASAASEARVACLLIVPEFFRAKGSKLQLELFPSNLIVYILLTSAGLLHLATLTQYGMVFQNIIESLIIESGSHEGCLYLVFIVLVHLDHFCELLREQLRRHAALDVLVSHHRARVHNTTPFAEQIDELLSIASNFQRYSDLAAKSLWLRRGLHRVPPHHPRRVQVDPRPRSQKADLESVTDNDSDIALKQIDTFTILLRPPLGHFYLSDRDAYPRQRPSRIRRVISK
ncbi:hypothetical protein FBULB1_2161 [Fusarium bulbicola]|nr:hypothetical protein FBULB1_2161 [Fusarium bulbicola]